MYLFMVACVARGAAETAGGRHAHRGIAHTSSSRKPSYEVSPPAVSHVVTGMCPPLNKDPLAVYVSLGHTYSEKSLPT